MQLQLAETIILYSMESINPPRRNVVIAKKKQYPPSQYHFFLTANHKHYMLLLNTQSAYFIEVKEEGATLINELKIAALRPLQFLSTGHGDIHILHGKGILWQYVDLLAAGQSFSNIKFEHEIRPLKFIFLSKGSYIVICQDSDLVWIEGQKIVKTGKYPSNMLMQQLVFDNEKREPFEARLVVPSKDLSLPYIFSDRELFQWKRDNYLEEISSFCGNYYLKDENLPELYTSLCFSSKFNAIYLIVPKQLIVLSIRRAGKDAVDYLASIRIKVNLQQTQSLLGTHINSISGALLLFTRAKVREVDPVHYTADTVSLKQKQREGQMIYCGYTLNASNSFIFLLNDTSCTKIRLVVIQR